jgi:hypothetical protein
MLLHFNTAHLNTIMTQQHHVTATTSSHTSQLLSIQSMYVSKCKKLQKKVTFGANDCNEVRTFISDEVPIEKLWFSYQDFEQAKRESRNGAREWRRMKCDKLLKHAFAIDASDPDCILSKCSPQSLINTFCALDGVMNQRGMERNCCQKLGQMRSEAKTRSKYAVLDTQRQYRCNGGVECFNTEQMAKAIAAKYIQSCRETKIFARKMGIGDEQAVLAPQSLDQIQDALNLCRGPKQLRRLSNYSASTASSTGSSLDSAYVFNSYMNRMAIAPSNGRKVSTVPYSRPTKQEAKELYAAIA